MQKSQITIDATEVRNSFAASIQKMAETLRQSAQQEQGVEESALSFSIKKLDFEIKKLNSSKFRFLLIGDFNRGKSSILNVLLEQADLLPVGATATTAIPTFVKYGEKTKVAVHFKDGVIEELSVEEYKNKYTLNSKEVRSWIKRSCNSVSEWLNPLDHADFYCPVDLLSKGVEFIDTAGLNHTEAENEKTCEYVKESHAIIFVLSAEQPLTKNEKDYLTTVIKDKVRSVFFIINKWEIVDQNSMEEIHENFVYELSESLNIQEEEVRQMWGDKIFDVYARNALDKIKSNDSLDGTGFLQFTQKLNSFLMNERLIGELYSSVQAARDVASSVVEDTLDVISVLQDDLVTLEEKIRKVKPHIKIMRRITESLDNEIQRSQNYSSSLVLESYKSYFLTRATNLEKEFEMTPLSSLSEKNKKEYVSALSHRFEKYLQDKLNEWNKLSQFEVIKIQDMLIQKIKREIVEYESEREEIREILNENNRKFQDQVELQTSENDLLDKTKLTQINGSAMGKVVAGLTGGTVGVMAAGVGVAYTANVYAGTQLIISTVLGLTPLGWGLIATSAVVGGALALWGRSSEIDKFKKGMMMQLKVSLEKSVSDEEKLLSIKHHIQSLFVNFEKYNQQLLDDIESLERSLTNLLESKRENEIDCESESERLEDLSKSISSQWEAINLAYEKISV